MLQWLQWLIGIFAKAPAAKLRFEPPRFSLLPAKWLTAHEIDSPPLCAWVAVENFGASVLRTLRIKLDQSPNYPIEAQGLPPNAWRFVPAGNEIQIDFIDPAQVAIFVLFFDTPPASKLPPQLLCGDALVGSRSDWRWALYSAPIPWTVAGLASLIFLTTLGVGGWFVYQEQRSPEARIREEYFNRYVASQGIGACRPRTLIAAKGEVHEGEIGQHVHGIAGALTLNRSSSLQELMARSFTCDPGSLRSLTDATAACFTTKTHSKSSVPCWATTCGLTFALT